MALSSLFQQQPKAELPQANTSPFTQGLGYGDWFGKQANLKRITDPKLGGGGLVEAFTDGNYLYNVMRQKSGGGAGLTNEGPEVLGGNPVSIDRARLSDFYKHEETGELRPRIGSVSELLNPNTGEVYETNSYTGRAQGKTFQQFLIAAAAAMAGGYGLSAAMGAGAAGGGAVGGGVAGGSGVGTGTAAGTAGSFGASSAAGAGGSSLFGGFGVPMAGTAGAGTGFGSGMAMGSGLGGALGAGAGGFGATLASTMAGMQPSFLSSLASNPLARFAAGKVAGKLIGGSGGGGGGSSNGGGMGTGGFGLGDLFNLGAGAVDANRQGAAADKMQQWMQGQQDYVRNYGKEGSPEFEYLRKTLEAKDAAAGRNSQYGTRSVDLLGQLGQAKLDASSRMALGFASPMQKALAQDAAKYAGLSAAGQKLLGGGNGIQNLSSILNGLGGNGIDFGGKDGLGGYDTDGTPLEGDWFNNLPEDDDLGFGFENGYGTDGTPVDGDFFNSDYFSDSDGNDIMSFMEGW
jgi:hypothetical protein